MKAKTRQYSSESNQSLAADQLAQMSIKGFYGKLEHIRELRPESKFHIGQIVRDDLSAIINICDWFQDGLQWWHTHRAYSA